MKKTLLLLACQTFSAAVFSQSNLPDCQPETVRHNCFAEYLTSAGNRYAGQWSIGQYAGVGTYTASNGDRYVGQFKDNQFNGRGTYYFANGERFTGEFKNGKKHGTGVFYSAKGIVLLEGVWKQDLFESRSANTKIPREIALAWKSRLEKEMAEIQLKPEYAGDWSKLISIPVSQLINQWLDEARGLNIQEIAPPKLPPPVVLTQEKWESDNEFAERFSQQQDLRQRDIERIIDNHSKLKEQRENNLKIIQAEKAAKQQLLPWVSQEFLLLAIAIEAPKVKPLSVSFDTKASVLYFDFEIGGQAPEKYEFKDTPIELRKAVLTELNGIQFKADTFANSNGSFGINRIRISAGNTSAYGTLMATNPDKQPIRLFTIDVAINTADQPLIPDIPDKQQPRPFVQIEVPIDSPSKTVPDSSRKSGVPASDNDDVNLKIDSAELPDLKNEGNDKRRQEQIKRIKALAEANKAFSPSTNYLGRLRARVRSNITFSESQFQTLKGNPEAEVEVTCSNTGQILSKKLIRSSSNKAWDEAVLNAIDKTGVLPRDENGYMPSKISFTFRPRD